MANKSLFATYAGKLLPRPNRRNRAGAPAYAYEPRHQLAQLAMTGTLSPTFYASAPTQLGDVMALVGKVEPRFLAKAAIYARAKGHMKDMPALLLAALSTRDPQIVREGVSARRRQRPHAAHVRADHAFGRRRP